MTDDELLAAADRVIATGKDGPLNPWPTEAMIEAGINEYLSLDDEQRAHTDTGLIVSRIYLAMEAASPRLAAERERAAREWRERLKAGIRTAHAPDLGPSVGATDGERR